ncbi:LacI family DNA-binding transcriptional regulator [Microbacterium sp.]|uniref:LacI family DNA-binding transcriptional regulator n=1 Tax=Microbacterium sp. TaxID=51671 RepID=UPI00391A5729
MADDKASRTANIFDVARLAGVSHQTVSRVLNDMPNVRPATRARVEQAIAQLRYSPSPAARALVTRRTRTIGLVTPGTVDFGPSSIAMNFNFAARAARYNVDAISSPQNDVAAVRTAIDGLLKQRVDAIVLVVVDTEVLAAVQALDIDIPIVAAATTGRPHPRLVAIDQYRGARSAVRHLLEAGYDTVRHIAGPARNPDAVERIRGWREEIAAARAQSTPAVHGDWSASSGYRIASEADLSPGEGIFVANDHMAIGVLSALRERGLRVPEDIGVVGFDDVPEAAFVHPSLTTVRQDFAALGEILMQKVLLLVEEPDTVTESTPLPTRLIVRGSAPASR